MYICYNKHNIITGVSKEFFEVVGCTIKEVPDRPEELWNSMLGTRVEGQEPKKKIEDLRVACICNWNDTCGISTYTGFLMNEISKQVKEVRIFSENNKAIKPDDDNVVRCWNRGESMVSAMRELIAWNPDFVIIQHEFGIFPKATSFLQMLQMLENIPYVVTLHSVYEHLDKTICTSAIKNILVHSEQGRNCLRKLGHNQNIFVVPHGCLKFDNIKELWNIFQNPYVLVQFGFGFFYKGVDRAIEAVHYLKTNDPKFKDIYYIYLCSDSGQFSSVHSEYYNYLLDKIEELGLQDNVNIIRKFHSEEAINTYLRTAKIALFPYVTNPTHVVYGASGAIRVAMANKIPVIASEGHMFDDLEGIVPRPHNAISLAQEIDEIFSNDQYKQELLAKITSYIENNTWDVVAKKYLDIYEAI